MHPMHIQLFSHTNEDKIRRHSSIEAARLTLISDFGVHTNCTTTKLLFGHPLFGYNMFRDIYKVVY
jgi:hypothetical protein